MLLNDYQTQAYTTATYGTGSKLFYPTLGLCGEAGELANKVKKVLRDDAGQVTDKKRDDLFAELGDCLWYIAAIASDLGCTLAEIAAANLAKLASRKDRGTIQGSGDNR